LSAERNSAVPAYMRTENAWYEEDCAWSIVACVFPWAFEETSLESARDTLANWYPDEYERFYGKMDRPSYERDKREFERINVENWVVTSACLTPEGAVECYATLGGKRSPGTKQRRFLVPKDEYHARGSHGFVIDPERHIEERRTA
jgi:hypothetical protein